MTFLQKSFFLKCYVLHFCLHSLFCIPDSGLFPSLGWLLLRHNPGHPSDVNVEPFFVWMPRCGVWNGGLYCFQNHTVEPSSLKEPPRMRLLHSAPWQSGIAFLFYCFGLRCWGLNSESCVGKAGHLPLSCIPSSYCNFKLQSNFSSFPPRKINTRPGSKERTTNSMGIQDCGESWTCHAKYEPHSHTPKEAKLCESINLKTMCVRIWY